MIHSLSFDEKYQAILSKDPAFEGLFITAVKTTGIFCRPVCTARKPKPENVVFYHNPQEAILHGYRPCKVCKPMQLAEVTPDYVHQLLDELAHDPQLRIKDADLRERGIEPSLIRRWFNKHHGRRGTLWMDRYKSVLVQDGDALRTMAAYIDLNPVRAGLAKASKDYRWCGYAEAVAGSKRARRGLCRVVDSPLDSWNDKAGPSDLSAAEWYRCWLFGEGVEVEASAVSSGRKGISTEEAKKVLEKGGQLSLSELLRCRVRLLRWRRL